MKISDARKAARYMRRLPRFLKERVDGEGSRSALARALAEREEAFLRMLSHGVFGHAASPYRPLLDRAGIGQQQIERMVAETGVEGSLCRLHEAGVYVSLEEFKGRRPIERPGLSYATAPRDFDNPLPPGGLEARTGGSRTAGDRVIIDLDLLAHEACYFRLFLEAFDVADRPVALWWPPPPVTAGIKNLLRYNRIGRTPRRWFVHFPPGTGKEGGRFRLYTSATIWIGRATANPLPAPEVRPLCAAPRVARWLAEQLARGRPGILDTNVSSAVRVCGAARENGLDICGSFFRLAGEPFTPAKARILAECGCAVGCHYAMAEVGSLGVACPEGHEPDDMHLLTDKIAVIRRPTPSGSGSTSADELVLTSLHPSSPKLMLNVESGDHARLEERSCGCPFGALGYTTHASGIRSREKLTGEGVTFLGDELQRLIDEILPRRFGGTPLDYQLVETEQDGLTRVLIVASPRIGRIDEEALVCTVLESLRAGPGGDVMTPLWRDGRTLQVARREPYTTPSAKILPLHVSRPRGCC